MLSRKLLTAKSVGELPWRGSSALLGHTRFGELCCCPRRALWVIQTEGEEGRECPEVGWALGRVKTGVVPRIRARATEERWGIELRGIVRGCYRTECTALSTGHEHLGGEKQS